MLCLPVSISGHTSFPFKFQCHLLHTHEHKCPTYSVHDRVSGTRCCSLQSTRSRVCWPASSFSPSLVSWPSARACLSPRLQSQVNRRLQTTTINRHSYTQASTHALRNTYKQALLHSRIHISKHLRTQTSTQAFIKARTHENV